MTLLLWWTVVAYGVATVAFVWCARRRRDAIVPVGRIVLGVAGVVHLAAIGQLCLRGLHPLRETSGVLSLIALTLVAMYLATAARRPRFALLGVAVAPLAAVLVLLAGRVLLQAPPAAAISVSLLGKAHLAMVTLGVALFALAAVVALFYLVQEAALRRRRLGGILRRTPALTTLDRLSQRLAQLGFPLFTFALVVGGVWSTRLARPVSFRLEHLISGAIWIVFGGLLLARWRGGISARRAAWLTVIGFLAIAVVFGAYIWRRAVG